MAYPGHASPPPIPPFPRQGGRGRRPREARGKSRTEWPCTLLQDHCRSLVTPSRLAGQPQIGAEYDYGVHVRGKGRLECCKGDRSGEEIARTDYDAPRYWAHLAEEGERGWHGLFSESEDPQHPTLRHPGSGAVERIERIFSIIRGAARM